MDDGLTKAGIKLFLDNPRGYTLWLKEKNVFQNKSKKEELQKIINEREKELTELNKKQKNLENRISERSKNSKE